MARRDAVPSARAGKATPVVLLLLAAIAAMAWLAVVPDFRRSRDAFAVELAARAARACDRVAREYVAEAFVESAADVTLDMVDDYYARLEDDEEEPPVWPRAADLSTVDFSDTNGVTVVVRLHDGPRRVSAADALRPEAAR